jgi:hypothetical protein
MISKLSDFTYSKCAINIDPFRVKLLLGDSLDYTLSIYLYCTKGITIFVTHPV